MSCLRLFLAACLCGWLAACACDPALADTQGMRSALYALQATDCVSSGVLQREHPGIARELDPVARPFSHGGVTMFCLGTALQDVIVGALTRRWSPAQKQIVVSVQIAGHAFGIETTFRNWHLR